MLTKTLHCTNPDCPNDNPQPVLNFYRRPLSKKGYFSRCKTCVQKYEASHWLKIRDDKITDHTKECEQLLAKNLWICKHPKCEHKGMPQPVKNFRIKRIKKRTGGFTYHSWCNKCNEKHTKMIYEANCKWLNNYLSKHSCEHCGFDNNMCLEFHHVRGRKVNKISYLRQCANFEALVKEVKKCIVLCKNCHVKYHLHHGLKRKRKTVRVKNPLHRKIDMQAKKQGCKICKTKDLEVLCYHHRNPLEKKYAMTTLINVCYRTEILMNEMAKCDVLCHNCHRILHKELSKSCKF